MGPPLPLPPLSLTHTYTHKNFLLGSSSPPFIFIPSCCIFHNSENMTQKLCQASIEISQCFLFTTVFLMDVYIFHKSKNQPPSQPVETIGLKFASKLQGVSKDLDPQLYLPERKCCRRIEPLSLDLCQITFIQ